MPAKPISVTLALGTDAYQQSLPAALLRAAMLQRVVSFRPGPEIADPNGAGSLRVIRTFPAFKSANRILWAAWRRIPGTEHSYLPKVASTWLADRLAAKYVPQSDIFHGLSGNCLACARAAKRGGALAILESPTLHLQHWQDEVKADCARFGINPRDCASLLPRSMVRRAEREYELCDGIIVLSSSARQSFVDSGFAHKTVVVLPGVDHRFFAPSPATEDADADVFRVCYVGRVEVAKGVAYLLEAWKRLGLSRAELVLAGEVKPEMTRLLQGHPATSVKVLGALSREQVVQRYCESSVLAMPSANEGLAMVLLEAMASGIPVIATDKTGALDVVTEGGDGFVVPARSVEALAEKILWCYLHRDETRAMGRAARAKVEQNFTLARYEERQLEMYRRLVSEARRGSQA